jgi:hypothetical protein
MVGFSEWARGGDRWRQCRQGVLASRYREREGDERRSRWGGKKIKEIKRKEKKKGHYGHLIIFIYH